MEKIVNELKKLVDFKDTTDIGDIVLIAAKDPQFVVFAVVTDIERDSSRKDEWWHLYFSVLSIPIQKMTWTLRTPQMSGMEIFTMDGKERFVKAVNMGGPQLKPVASITVPRPGGLKRIK
ncbi:hypothetical protein JWG42_02275 [Desulfoprunum benzoelyticum]|uniref:Uncharacterized protein n=1 Tax=Desulfoprunum benzoelyticum TaxID=1506996 RepID=A0A840UL65_9BACT|nr:hypothetical protein [Desulfoprunum benzoelyticum]MBB5346492.1 hypothetical protein [Desulfoprunum benzoelyticum]MBM9528979.1 hypothetical protein [Desulfoprunum benzoelyticum]